MAVQGIRRNHTRSMAVLLLEPLVFAVLATLGFGLRGRYGLAVVAIGWVAAVSMHILASVPGPGIPLHDFERTPVPSIAATVAGTLAGAAFVVLKRGDGPLWIRMAGTAVVYLVVFVLVGLAVFAAYMM
jgi:hypothetical protein